MELRILGRLEVLAAGETLPLGGPKQRSFLAALLLARSRTLSRDRLAEMLWGDEPPATYEHSLEVYASSLRKSLRVAGDGVTLTGGAAGYRLDRGQPLDSEEFERLASEGEAQSLDRMAAVEKLDAALDLWRGDVLEDLEPMPWVTALRDRLDALRLGARRRKLQIELDLGRHVAVLPQLQSLAMQYPLDEGIHRLLILALYRSGGQPEATAAFHRLRENLRDELGLEPSPETQQLHADVLKHSTRLQAVTRAPGNLPAPLTSFVARAGELDQLAELVRQRRRLITVLGAGGMGKTRLAIELGRELGPEFEAGAWIVELASLTSPDQVDHAVAAALQIRERADAPLLRQISDVLRDRRLLLIVDNCEHVVAGVASCVGALLQASADLHVVATSRQPLRLAGETVWRIPPLEALSEDEPATVAALWSAPASRLFLDRAQHSHPGFELRDSDAPALAEIARRLDGMPLALELAAAQVDALDVNVMRQRVDATRELLQGRAEFGGHGERTLLAAFEWSYGLLSKGEQQLFTRLSVFGGSFSLDSAEAVGAEDRDGAVRVAAAVAGLAAKSMVTPYASESAHRYRLLEVLKQLGRSKLSTDEMRSLQHLLAHHLLARALDSELRIHWEGGGQWLQSAILDHDNVAGAISWAEHDDPDLFCSLVAAWAPVWVNSWRFDQRRSLETAERKALDRTHSSAGVLALNLARLTTFQGDLGTSEDALGRALDAAERAGDQRSRAHCLFTESALRAAQRRPAECRASATAAIQAAEALLAADATDRLALVVLSGALNNLADTYCEDDPDRAIELARRALALEEARGDEYFIAITLATIAHAQLRLRRLDEARATLREMVAAATDHDLWLAAAAVLTMILLAAEGRHEAAFRAYLAGERIVRRIHGVFAPGDATVEMQSTLETVRRTLGPKRCEQIAAHTADADTGTVAALLEDELGPRRLRVVATKAEEN